MAQMIADETVWLFSYGTLQLPHIQDRLFGRRLRGEPDTLTGFALGTITITEADGGEVVHKILRSSDRGHQISGVALAISWSELAIVDDYEGSDYARIEVTLRSGRTAFVYVEPASA